MLDKIIRFFLVNKLVVVILLLLFIGWGMAVAPFNWNIDWLPRDPVPVDAIPDIGENQQIVYTEWMGRSPQDVEDQITYPLTSALLGIPGVKTIRSSSIFGLSSIYVIFGEDIEFYWSRSRILEKLNSLPAGTLPVGVQPALGPDATALGQVFWYTLEGRDPETGRPTGGWDPHELRTIQDYYVGYSLTTATGVSEVAAIGGFIKEYQVDIDPDAMKQYNVNVAQIMNAVQKSNLDVGARTIEFNKAEYLVRGLGYIQNPGDLEKAVVRVKDNTPIRIKDVAVVNFGPVTRRGGLDKEGAEATGAVVVARYGANPLQVINNVKEKIQEISPGLPSRVLPDGTVSKVTIVPFYDRTGLIYETLGTLEEALTLEILISMIVVIIAVLNLRASLLISSLLPLGVLMTFIVMQYTGVDANIVALSGIAIAIGVMVDVGVVFTENIVRHLELPENKNAKGKEKLEIIYRATTEVATAVLTALTTTVVSFLPVFAMQAEEGKLFKPLAFTKTYAMLAALFIGLVVIPAFAHWLFSVELGRKRTLRIWNIALIALGLLVLVTEATWGGIVLLALGVNNLSHEFLPEKWKFIHEYVNIAIILITVTAFLALEWLPLGAQNSLLLNILFVLAAIVLVLGSLLLVVKYYTPILQWCLKYKRQFMLAPVLIFLWGSLAWGGFENFFGFAADGAEKAGLEVRQTGVWQSLSSTFPGLGEEFMPALDEGSFLLMPTTMAHSGVEENIDVIRKVDSYVSSIPEVELTVGKWGRVNSALDPAPISMFENTILYKPEYILDENGHRMRFKVDDDGAYLLTDGSKYDPEKEGYADINKEKLVPDKNGKHFRQWRTEIESPDDIWDEIVKATQIPGLTSAPKLQPIQTRLIMLATGMRAPIGIKIYGPDLKSIENVGLEMEGILQQVPSIKPSSVFADRIVGKPYLELKINREEIARYGLTIAEVQKHIEVAIGGIPLTTTVEGRERFPVRARYARGYRDNPDDLKKVLIATATGTQIPLGELAEVTYRRGPQMVKSEDTFLVGYVIFDKKDGYAEVDVVEEARRFIETRIASGEFEVPAGVSYRFAGNFENQQRATKRLSVVIPISLLVIFLILYFQFGRVSTTSIVFSGVFVAFAGGFILIWLYGQDWFLNLSLAGNNMRDLFQVHTVNLSVAVWVGFIALFGVASDNGVIMATYLKQVFEREKPGSIPEVRKAVLEAGKMRIRPAMMTTATTIIALLPIFTSTGKGSDIMVPMAIPTFGGMLVQVITVFVVPVLYAMWQERKLKTIEK